jgi:hypothetical protein
MVMEIRNAIIRSLDYLSFGALSGYFREAAIVGSDQTTEELFRSFTAKKRDLKPLQFRQQQEMAFYQWQRYMLPKRIISIMLDYTVGDELNVNLKIMKRVRDDEDIDTEREDAQKVWDDFFEDPINDGERDLIKMLESLLISGELVLPTFVTPGTGAVRLGFIDPGNIERVIVDPLDQRNVREIIVKPQNSTSEIPLRVVQYDSEPKSETYGRLNGQVIYWRINNLLSQTRGQSELIRILDWTDALEQFLFDALDGFALRNAFVWDLELAGKTEEQIKAMNIPAPKTGTTFAHNEKVKLEAVTPSLNSVDIKEGAEIVMDYIAGGIGIPKTWFSKGEGANRAIAQEMNKPVMRMLKRKQLEIKLLIKHLVKYITDQAILAGALKMADDEYVDVEISAFDFDKEEVSVTSQAFVQIVTAMKVALSERWISDEDARRTVAILMRKLGIDIIEGGDDDDESNKKTRDNGEDINIPSFEEYLNRSGQS